MRAKLQQNGGLGPLSPERRRDASCDLRVHVADYYRRHPIPPHENNGDEQRYQAENYYANYSKGLPHKKDGEVEPEAYRSLLQILESGRPEDFERLPSGIPYPGFIGFTDPQSGLAYDLEGIDSHQLGLVPCPPFRSPGTMAEIAENYWMALSRDVAFIDYDADPTINAAAADLSSFEAFDGPRDNSGRVTPRTLFRGSTPGDLAGPYLSQFFVRDVPYGAQMISSPLAFAVPNGSYMTNEEEYLAFQNGAKPSIVPLPIAPHRMHNGRDLGNYVHIDELYQEYLIACLLLITPRERNGFGAPVSPGNPYVSSHTQVGFGTLGEPNFKVLVAEVATRALKAVWFQKWFVHRRMRPEEFGARLHWHLVHRREYEFDAAAFETMRNGVLSQPAIAQAQYFLPMAFPEGCPTHPAYGAGHATVAGACVTVLKALFEENAKLADLGVQILEPNRDGSGLQPYTGSGGDALTVGGELNKLASNVGLARNFAGVHWRSDYTNSIALGEQVAIYFLSDYIQTYNEHVTFEFTRFSGEKIRISKDGSVQASPEPASA